jgi:hypothetical protein
MTEHQYQLAMTYGKRNLALATLANNNNWIAYALVFLSQIYSGIGKRDSASHYLDKCVTYIEDVPDSQRVDFYNYIAALTLKTDLSAAHTYAMKGNDIRPNSLSYITLAKIRCREGVDNAIIDSLCDMVTGDRFLSPWFLSPSMIMIFCLFINFILLVTLINQYQFLAFV